MAVDRKEVIIFTGSQPFNSSVWFRGEAALDAARAGIATICNTTATDSLILLTKYASHVVKYNETLEGDGRGRGVELGENRESRARRGGQKNSLVFYQRDRTRRFVNLPGIIREVVSWQGGSVGQWSITIIHHSEHLHPCVLKEIMGKVDVFVTAHGFQCTALFFMKPGATFLELFPYKYFKPSYAPLAQSLGLRHRWVMNSGTVSASAGLLMSVTQDNCMAYFKCRKFARRQDVQWENSHKRLLYNEMQRVEQGKG